MPNFGSHLSGPIRHTTRFRNQSDRAWFRDLPVGTNDPDFVHTLIDFTQTTDYNTIGAFKISSSGTIAVNVLAAVTSSASALFGSSASSVNGNLLLQTGSTAGNYATIQSPCFSYILDRSLVANTHALQSAKALWFETQISADLTGNDVNIMVGLSDAVANPVINGQNYIGFTVASGAGTIACAASTGGTVTAVTKSVGSQNTVALAQGVFTKLGFAFSGSNNVDFYINRNYMTSFQVNALPTSPLALTAQIQTTAAVSRTLVIDYFYAAKMR